MKQFKLLGLACLATFGLQAQIKLFNNGNIAIGSIDSPRSNNEVRGNTVFTDTNTSIVTAPFIRGLNNYSTSLTPAYTFYNEDRTGFYLQSSMHLGLSIDGLSRIIFNQNGTIFTDNWSSLQSSGYGAMIRSKHTISSTSTPDYTFYNDDETGIYHPAGHHFGVTTNGISRLVINNTGSIFTNDFDNLGSIESAAKIRSLNSYSTATTPDYSWYGNDNSGMYHPDHNEICFSIDGVSALCMEWAWNSGLSVNWHKTTNNGTLQLLRGDQNESSSSQFMDLLFDPSVGGVINSGTHEVYFYDHESEDYNDLYTNEVFQLSDRNKKKNIINVDSNQLNKLYLLKAKRFNYINATATQPNKFGFLAQDVELIFPELVNTNRNGDKMVNYTALIPLLIENLKAQEQKINQLENRLNFCCQRATIPPASGNKSMRNKNGNGELENDYLEVANGHELYQNVPNPFDEGTQIKWFIAGEQSANAMLYVFTLNGQMLFKRAISQAGEGSYRFEKDNLEAGMYLYSLYVDGQEVDTKRMIINQ